MKPAITATIDSAGHLVLPKEIESLTRDVRLVRKGRMRVAVPVEEGDLLEGAAVRETVKLVRGRR